MKLIIKLITCLIIFATTTYAQQKVVQGEYFWNTDPGEGSGTVLLALDGNFNQALEELFQNGISVGSLTQGAHSFNVRIKGQDGAWSNTFKQTIFVQGPLTTITRTTQVVQGEYFWNSDPGEGNGTALIALDGNFNQALEELFQNGISVGSLSQGAHSFNVRVKGQDGAWSNAFKQTIFVQAPLTIITRTTQVVQGEYFWNADPGEGSGTALLALDGNFNQALEELFQNGISVGSLTQGAHSFNVRVKGQDGAWSNTFKQTIFVQAPLTIITRTTQVVQGEYFWNSDPGEGNGTALLALDGNFNQALEGLFQNGISVGSLSQGAHSFNVRVKGQDGAWSNTFKQTIFVQAPLTIITRTTQVVQGEYFWNADPGEGSGTALLALDGNFNQALEELFQNGISVGSLTQGAHSFNVRVKGQDGAWSNTFKQTIFVQAPLTIITRTTQVVQGECFWNADPGEGSGTALLALDGNFNQALEEAFTTINTTNLPGGANLFSVRVKGEDGTWSNAFKQVIYILPTNSCVVTSTVVASQSTICVGASVTFTAIATNGGANPIYQWKLNGNNVGTNISTYTNSALSNNDVITCHITTSDPCAINPLSASNNITITSFSNPTIAVNSGVLCSGNSFTITPTGASSYTIQGGITIVNPTVNTTYTVIGSNGSCLSQNIVTASVTVVSTPTISVNSGTVCAGKTFTIMPTGASSYTIQGGNTIVSPLANTIYTVVGYNSGCKSTNTATSQVMVYANPTVSIVSSNTLLCVGQQATLTASGASTYTWSTNQNVNSITISPVINTTYLATGINLNGCSNSISYLQNVSFCTDLENSFANEESGWLVYPNPAKNVLYIKNNFDDMIAANFTIYNALGQNVIGYQITECLSTIDLTTLSTGFYTIQISNGTSTSVQKIIVE